MGVNIILAYFRRQQVYILMTISLRTSVITVFLLASTAALSQAKRIVHYHLADSLLQAGQFIRAHSILKNVLELSNEEDTIYRDSYWWLVGATS